MPFSHSPGGSKCVEMADEKIEGESEKFKRPLGVTSDDEDDNTVRVCVVFPGLKKKTFSSQASNGTVLCEFKTRTLDVKLTMKASGNDKEEKYRYYVRKLPDDIIPEKCTWKVKKDQVVIILHKANPRSWARELADVGLETYVDEEEGEGAEDM